MDPVLDRLALGHDQEQEGPAATGWIAQPRAFFVDPLELVTEGRAPEVGEDPRIAAVEREGVDREAHRSRPATLTGLRLRRPPPRSRPPRRRPGPRRPGPRGTRAVATSGSRRHRSPAPAIRDGTTPSQ